MARQLNYARALVPVRPQNYDIQPFQYQPASRLTHYKIQSGNENLPALKAREMSIVQEYRENSRILFSKPDSTVFYTKSSSEKIKDAAKRNNIDFLYKFVDIIEKDFLTLLSDSHLTHREPK